MTKTITERKTSSIKEGAGFLGSIRESISLKKGVEFLKMAWATNPKETDSYSYNCSTLEKGALQSRAEVEYTIAQAYAICLEQRRYKI